MKHLTIILLITLSLFFSAGCVDKDAYFNKVRPIAAEMDGITHYEVDATPITYGEYIPKIQATTERIGVLSRTVRSEKSPFNEQKTDSLYTYFDMCGKFMAQLGDFKVTQMRASGASQIPNYTQEIVDAKLELLGVYKDQQADLQETAQRLIKLADYVDEYVPRDCLADETFFNTIAKIRI